MAALTKWSFNRLLWNEKGAYLYDVVDSGPPDASIRSNQIFAVSLAHTMLTPERAKRVVDTIEQHLLTPYGLRTLAPNDSEYLGRYAATPAAEMALITRGPSGRGYLDHSSSHTSK